MRITNAQLIRVFRYWHYRMWTELHGTGDQSKVFTKASTEMWEHAARLRDKYSLTHRQNEAVKDCIYRTCGACGVAELLATEAKCKNCPCKWGVDRGNWCRSYSSSFCQWSRSYNREERKGLALEVFEAWRE